MSFKGIQTKQLGKAKVCDLYHPVMLQNIGQFEVPVHDLVLGQSFEGVHDLDEEIHCLFLSESLFSLRYCMRSPSLQYSVTR